MNRVYIANFGMANSLWPTAKANATIVTIDNIKVHDFWRAGDREGYIHAALTHTVTALGATPTTATAGRWFNLIQELAVTQDDVWISRQGDALWWTVSSSEPLRETLIDSPQPKRDGPRAWLFEKPCQPWSDHDGEGRPLLWNALHPKARDFLSTEATFQSLANDRGYADYARALVAGEPLGSWESTALFRDKAAVAKRPGARIFSPRERAAARMAEMIMATVAGADGRVVERQLKVKSTTLGRLEWEALIKQLIGAQEERCAITGLPLGYDGDCEDKELLASLDRIDSSGHYTPENVQVVCRFVNRWKGADDDALARRLMDLLRLHFQQESERSS